MDNAPHRDPYHSDHVRNAAESDAVNQASKLSARLVYHVVLREGEEELERPTVSLVWSGIAAGVLISFSIVAEAIFVAKLPQTSWSPLVADIGYTLGFLLVILSRMQLFTENTISTVLPLLTRRDGATAMAVARLWVVVFAANLAGCLLAASFFVFTAALPSEVATAMAEISREAVSAAVSENFMRAIPAGVLIAALVWMTSSGDYENFLIVFVFTWLIAAGDFQHVIAGAVEMSYVVLSGEERLWPLVSEYQLPVLAGNIVGGTLVFTLTAWGQVRQEVKGGQD
ncbi:MAG: formate/nitrite transporter family protein [Limimaricola soesokkakensis]|uniref:formate/nitrite transporter family protein n=1 Tax=Limimaricola soesokkakensis TaxID=1343159 RepID=UPI0040597DB2